MDELDELRQLNKQNDDEIEIDLRELLQLLIQKVWIAFVCCIIGAALMFGYTKLFVTPMYSATSMIYILTKTTSVTSLADIQMGAQLTSDFEMLAKSRPVVEGVIDDLGLECSYESLVGMISTTNPNDTRFLQLTVRHSDPEMAKNIANSLADATAEQVAYVMSTDKPNIVERAVTPSYPSSPNTVKNMTVGALVGVILAIAVIVIRFLMNDTIQTEEDVRKYLNLNTLAAVPLEKRK